MGVFSCSGTPVGVFRWSGGPVGVFLNNFEFKNIYIFRLCEQMRANQVK